MNLNNKTLLYYLHVITSDVSYYTFEFFYSDRIYQNLAIHFILIPVTSIFIFQPVILNSTEHL